MTNATSKMNNVGVGLVDQLHTMLTNHPERPTYHLNISLLGAGGEKIKQDEFDIFAREPVSKIEGKIEKLRTRGGYPTLKILEIKNVKDDVALVLQV